MHPEKGAPEEVTPVGPVVPVLRNPHLRVRAAQQRAYLVLELLNGFGRRREGYCIDARFGDPDAIQSGMLIGVALAIGADADGVARDRYSAATA